MKRPRLQDRLAHVPAFAALDDGARAALAQSSTRRRVRAGQVLFHQGSPAAAAAVVLSGRVDVERTDGRGDRVVLRQLGPHHVVGLSALAGARLSADVVVGESGDVLVIPASALRALFRRSPVVSLAVIGYLADLVGELTDELDDLRAPTLEERLLRRINRMARHQRELHATHAQLAALVGATRANVSRALKKLEARGLLSRHRGRLELL